MRAVRLLEYALTKEPKTVLDVGTGHGYHAMSFLAQGCSVTGLDVVPPQVVHKNLTSIQNTWEGATAELEGQEFDMIWCCHVLEHIQNIQSFSMWLRKHLKPGGWLMLAVPPSRQNRFHIGHCTLWTPAHLVYNLICSGWDCKDANWYTEYMTIGISLQRVDDVDMSGRTTVPSEAPWLNQYAPLTFRHENGAWWGNRWHEFVESDRIMDPPFVTAGLQAANYFNLPPAVQLAYGPNPELRKGYERDEES